MASFVPQLVKLLHAKNAEGISLHTYCVMVAGFMLWVAYGLMLGSWPIAASNTVNLILSATILALKYRTERKDQA